MVELPGQAGYRRFIVKFREDTPAAGDEGAAVERLDAAVRAAGGLSGEGGPPLRLQRLRRLGIGADVLAAERPLDRGQATRLLQALEADPDVEYAEVDAMMRIGPGGLPGVA